MRKLILGVVLGALVVFASSVTLTFQYESEFADAQSAIGDAASALEAMTNEKRVGTIYMLISEARQWLDSAEYYHENATGLMDRGRAMVQTYTAIAYAKVAEFLAEF